MNPLVVYGYSGIALLQSRAMMGGSFSLSRGLGSELALIAVVTVSCAGVK